MIKELNVNRAVRLYLVALFGYFPLVVLSYASISTVKYINFIVITVAGALLCLSSLFIDRNTYEHDKKPLAKRIKCISSTSWFFIGFVLIQLLSTLLCSYGAQTAWLGDGRCEGMLLLLLYALVFAGVSAFARFDGLYIVVLAVVLVLMNILAAVQLCGINAFGLYPDDTMYTKEYYLNFFSTIGNIDVLAAFYCVALPLVAVSFVVLKQSFWEKALIAAAVLSGAYVVAEINVSASLLSFAAVCAFALPILCCRDRLPKTLAVCALACAGVAVAFCVDRSLNENEKCFDLSFEITGIAVVFAVAAVILAVAALLLRNKVNLPVKPVLISGYAVMAAAVAVVVVWLWRFAPTDEAAPDLVREAAKLLRGQVDEYSGTHRVAIWKCSLEVLKAYPILGTGAGAFKQAFAQLAGDAYKAYSSLTVDSAHNEWLQVACSFGLVGLTAYLGWLVTLFVRACRRMSKNACLIPLCCALLGYVVQSLFSLSIVLTIPFLVAVAGLINAECGASR